MEKRAPAMSTTKDGIYVVSSGTYSDYSVLVACPSKKDADLLAQRYAASGGYGYDDARVEWLPIVPGDVQQVTVLHMSTTLWDDGSETDTRERLTVKWPFELDDPKHADCTWRWVSAPMHHGKGGRLDVHGTDHERVRKVLGDQRALLITDDAYRARREITGGV